MALTMQEFREFVPKKTTFALFGYPIGHSVSPELHAMLFQASGQDYDYIAIEVPPEDLPEATWLAREKLRGINVTIPHKAAIIPLLDAVDTAAKDLGKVNTVDFRDGEAIGYNTDILGFAASLERDGVTIPGATAVVLGYGGVSSVMAYHLVNAGARVIISGRSAEKAIALRDYLRACLPDGMVSVYPPTQLPHATSIVVNGTPVGMTPKEDANPLSSLPHGTKYVFDAIYNPPTTALLRMAEEKGIATRDGLYMLVMQAAYAQTVWLGSQFDNSDLDLILRRLYGDVVKKRMASVYHKSNLVLCGFMGSGKTTIGRKIARLLGLEFIDMDIYLEQQEGRKISDIFAEDGEPYFRDLETKYARELSEKNGCVIATGGGCVLRPENVELLKKNGILIHLDTPFFRIVQNLSRDTSRPLLQGDKEKQTRTLYSQRKKIYEDCADVSVRGVRISEILMKLFRAL